MDSARVKGRYSFYIPNMRQAKLTQDEIMAAEKAVDDRQRNRNKGFRKMHDRDAGQHRFKNGVVIEWPVPSAWTDEINGIATRIGNAIPEGKFVLKFNGRSVAFDAEEFRKQLRWV